MAELVQMLSLPAEGVLDGIVERLEVALLSQLESSSDTRRDFEQRNFEFEVR